MGKKSEPGKGIHIDEDSLAMFRRYVQEQVKPTENRATNKDLALEFKVPERTFIRRVKIVQTAMEKFNEVAIPLPGQPEKRGPMGSISRAVVTGRPSPGMALATREKGDYSIIPEMSGKNPLDNLSDAQISQAGIAVGAVFGGGLQKMGQALLETDRPLAERAILMAQGSNGVASMALGLFESLRLAGIIGQPRPIKEIPDTSDRR